MNDQQNTEDNYKKIQQTFPDFESLTAFFENKTAEYACPFIKLGMA